MHSSVPRSSEEQMTGPDGRRPRARVSGRLSWMLRLSGLLVAFLMAGNLAQCSFQLPCASGDPTCSPEGIFALVAGGRPPVFLVGTDAGQILYSADDGATWTTVFLSDPGFAVNGFAESGGNLFAFGSNGSGVGAFYTLSSLAEPAGPFLLTGKAALIEGDGDGVRTLAIESGTNDVFRLDSDGGYAFVSNPSSGGSIDLFTNTQGFWFYSESGGSNRLFYTNDGVSWNVPSTAEPFEPLTDIAFIGTRFLASSSGAEPFFNTPTGNLDDWQPPGVGGNSNAMCSDGTRLLAATPAGQMYNTSDGVSISGPVNTSTASPLGDIACRPDVFIAIPQAAGDWTRSVQSGNPGSWQLIANPTGPANPTAIEFFP